MTFYEYNKEALQNNRIAVEKTIRRVLQLTVLFSSCKTLNKSTFYIILIFFKLMA